MHVLDDLIRAPAESLWFDQWVIKILLKMISNLMGLWSQVQLDCLVFHQNHPTLSEISCALSTIVLFINYQKWLLLNMCTVPNRNTTLVLLYYPGWGSTRVTAPARNNIGCPPSLELLLHGLIPHLNEPQKCIVCSVLSAALQGIVTSKPLSREHHREEWNGKWIISQQSNIL